MPEAVDAGQASSEWWLEQMLEPGHTDHLFDGLVASSVATSDFRTLPFVVRPKFISFDAITLRFARIGQGQVHWTSPADRSPHTAQVRLCTLYACGPHPDRLRVAGAGRKISRIARSDCAGSKPRHLFSILLSDVPHPQSDSSEVQRSELPDTSGQPRLSSQECHRQDAGLDPRNDRM